MSRGMSSRIRMIVALLGILVAISAGLLFWQSTQTERAFVFANNFPQYTFIGNSTEAFLIPVQVPVNREFAVITDPNQIVGKYTGHHVGVNQLVQTTMIIDALPSNQRQFTLSLLPLNTRAYPIDIPKNIGEAFVSQDLIDIYALQDVDGFPSQDDSGVVLFQKLTFLGEEEGIFLAALNVDQILAYEGWKKLPGVTFTAAISQAANGDYAPLHEGPLYPDYTDAAIRGLFAAPTPTPSPTPPATMIPEEG